ncbi:VWA domain-containing protein [Pseudoalteromonas sp. SR44-5]|jgi:Ca-activated chloride channel family protein|uniref:VWA domain-containing protein n=2 Tax=Pseudoalteromonas TaxID=53246 RepID=A0ABY3FAI6_9GAMM|nr:MULTISPECIES: VWA domain-containing protein [Pseudoalteromonas]MBB1293779.1 VWA domain-containing protein [Pseudoalteromonas sp. SR41-4]MBB1301191.1 VWA domain-containing protein [Pseudoalteromonas sp. SR44-8]MBB1310940.1 VWA domain-containing protein [Pseudoalteromonas sp. SR41-8]MBB1334498.1 VWA domain-containing protein [Pseudoalteromonas sp. SR41-6]MBB1367402.1 VWA domain-containing protein [Pseudoalteromonas sp. SR44-5]|tara:strand:+ start:10151 stop:11137 length:987 start_codon:yes stop_codon:yes gene_type:complete
MFEFSWPWLFVLLPLPWLLRLFKPVHSEGNTRLRIPSFAKHNLGAQVVQQQARGISIFEWLVWLLLVTALANPTWLDEPITLPNEGRDIMLAVDLSGSMTEQDMAYQGQYVDRLTMVKAVLSDFIEQRQGDRLGLILFGDTAFLQTPLTRDVKTVSQMLSEAQIGLVGRATAIGDALGLSVKRFASKDESNRIVVLLTDGQNTAGNLDPEEALLLAREEGIKVYTIGVGSDNPRGFSLFNMGGMSGGSLDETLLKRIAEQTGGLYFRAKDVAGLQQIYQELDKLEPISADEQTFRPQSALFYFPLLIALTLIGLRVMFISAKALRQEA